MQFSEAVLEWKAAEAALREFEMALRGRTDGVTDADREKLQRMRIDAGRRFRVMLDLASAARPSDNPTAESTS